MAASPFLHPVPFDGVSPKPFSKLPQMARAGHQLCEIHVPSDVISDLRHLVKAARLGPVTFETSQQETNEDYGITRHWIEEAQKAWMDDSKFNWYSPTFPPTH